MVVKKLVVITDQLKIDFFSLKALVGKSFNFCY